MDNRVDGTDEVSAASQTGYRWYVLALLTLIAALNNIDKNLLSALAEPIKHEFALSDAQFGMVAGLMYSTGFAISGIPIGLMVDRINRSWLLAGLLAIWSAATTMGGFVNSFAQLGVTRLVVGCAEAGSAPVSLALIADWFRRDRRGTAIGIWTISRSIALAIGFGLGGAVALRSGWRAAFLLAGIPGLLVSVAVLFMRNPQRTAVAAGALSSQPHIKRLLSVLSDRKILLLLTIALILLVTSQNGLMTFMSAFLTRVHHLRIDQAGLALGFILGAGAGIGMPLGGVLTDVFNRFWPARSCYLIALLMIACVPFALGGMLMPNAAASIGCLFMFELLCSCGYTAGLAVYLNATPPGMRGALSAFLTVLVIFVGSGLGPVLAGTLSDALNKAGFGSPLQWALCLMTLLLLVGSFLAVAAGWIKPLEPTKAMT